MQKHSKKFMWIHHPKGGTALLSIPDMSVAHNNLMPKSTAWKVGKRGFPVENLTNTTSAKRLALKIQKKMLTIVGIKYIW